LRCDSSVTTRCSMAGQGATGALQCGNVATGQDTDLDATLMRPAARFAEIVDVN